MAEEWIDIENSQWTDKEEDQWIPVEQGSSDLSASIVAHQPQNLQALIDAHSPRNLAAYIAAHLPGNLSASIQGGDFRYLSANMSAHSPKDLEAAIFTKQREERLLSASIYAWHKGDLSAYLNTVYSSDLSANVSSELPVDLPAYLKPWPQKYLPASIWGLGNFNLSAVINSVTDNVVDLSAYIKQIYHSDLQGKIYGYVHGSKDLSAYIGVMYWYDLTATIRATYFSDLSATIGMHTSKNILASIHGWEERFLQAQITGTRYPWDLNASINGTGYWNMLSANVTPMRALNIYNDLSANVASWKIEDLLASIYADNAVSLSASLYPLGQASDLHASIRPKMIRLTTIIDVPTLAHGDLSATINFLCGQTGYSNLIASIYAKYKSDLYATIRGISPNNTSRDLGAKIGYADSFLEVDKLKIGITIHPSSFFTEDKFKLYFSFFKGGVLLSASIRGTLRYNDLTANIIGEELSKYVYTTTFKNREIVVNKTYDGIFRSYEIVELAFRSAVKDYFYSSDGNYAWKKDRLERWMLDVRSILPANTALRLKRRLHKATSVYDLRKFASIDEAVRFAIAYVTEYPQGNLSASIYNRGTFALLPAILNAKYIKSDRGSLPASVTPVGATVVVNTVGGVSKI